MQGRASAYGLPRPGAAARLHPMTSPSREIGGILVDHQLEALFGSALRPARDGLPLEAALGGAQTIYPEYRKRLQMSYKPPTACTRYCCGAGGLNVQASGLNCRTR